MRTTFGIAALAAVAAARGRVGQDALSMQLRADPKFTSFLGRNNKSCKDVAEFNLRSGIYHHTDDIIAANNREAAHSSDKDHVVMGHNFMSDLTTEEKEQYYGLKMDMEHAQFATMASGNSQHHGGKRSKNRGRGLAGTSATNVDHANDGFMYAVKDQTAQCGSCWAFASTSTLEGTMAKKLNMNPVRLSEQQSVDCTYKSGNDKFDENYQCYGCQGCWFENSWKMMKDQGVMTNDDYSYTARVETCQHDFNKIWGYVTGYKQIPEGSDIADIKKVLKKQPIAIAVDAARPAWQFYKSGVVKKTDGCYKQLNHAVVLVGYTDSTDDMDDDDDDDNNDGDDEDGDDNPDDDAECQVNKWWYSCGSQRRMLRKSLGAGDDDGHDKYFKIQNSWGKGWGSKGFILLEIEDGNQGTCGMYMDMMYVDGVMA